MLLRVVLCIDDNPVSQWHSVVQAKCVILLAPAEIGRHSWRRITCKNQRVHPITIFDRNAKGTFLWCRAMPLNPEPLVILHQDRKYFNGISSNKSRYS